VRVETQSGTVMGTVNYMSPEQLLGQRVDLRCDIFSFAVVLCEMLTGTCPFACDNQIDTMHAILHEEPRLRDAVKSQLPPELFRILTRALDRPAEEALPDGRGTGRRTQSLQARPRTRSGRADADEDEARPQARLDAAARARD
jgi:serine/threonine protein kinase